MSDREKSIAAMKLFMQRLGQENNFKSLAFSPTKLKAPGQPRTLYKLPLIALDRNSD
jgi:hypothetical protein